MTTKHTPGPWEASAMGYESHPIYIRANYQLKRDGRLHGSAGAIAKIPASSFHNIDANARLIAAAPELLEALDELVACKALKERIAIHQQLLVHETEEEFQEMDCVMADYARRHPAAWEKARAAIAKATGDTNG